MFRTSRSEPDWRTHLFLRTQGSPLECSGGKLMSSPSSFHQANSSVGPQAWKVTVCSREPRKKEGGFRCVRQLSQQPRYSRIDELSCLKKTPNKYLTHSVTHHALHSTAASLTRHEQSVWNAASETYLQNLLHSRQTVADCNQHCSAYIAAKADTKMENTCHRLSTTTASKRSSCRLT